MERGPWLAVFVPQGMPHGFRVSDAGPGRTLLIMAPSGFDEFVAELSERPGG